MSLLASQTAFAISALSQLVEIGKAAGYTASAGESPAAPRVNQPRHSARNIKMEARFCAPGMECYAGAARSQDPMLIKIARHLQDRQVPVSHAKGTRFAPIGALFNHTLGARSTAYLVGECHAMTTAHSIVGRKSTQHVRYDPAKSDPKVALKTMNLEFKVGRSSTSVHAPFENSVKATVETMGKFNPYNASDDEDWALLRLSKCIGTEDQYGHFELREAEVESVIGAVFGSIGFPGDRSIDAGAWIDPKCTVHGKSIKGSWTNVWAVDCNTVSGMSGAPLLRRTREGKLHVFGMTTSEIVTTDRIVDGFSIADANHVLSTKAFYSKIKPYIEKPPLAKRK